jgi:hypothetical protein
MIHYQLQCRQSHGFDGWFPNSSAFDVQVARGMVVCPVCADTSISRALMAPALARSRQAVLPAAAEAKPVEAEGKAVAVAKPAETPMAVAGEGMPDHVRAMLQRLRSEVERNCDYVGPKFADEARRIHKGEATPRGIYGETTPEQAEALADEGIEVNRIPWVPRADG